MGKGHQLRVNERNRMQNWTGKEARNKGEPITSNPYPEGTGPWKRWRNGYEFADRKINEAKKWRKKEVNND